MCIDHKPLILSDILLGEYFFSRRATFRAKMRLKNVVAMVRNNGVFVDGTLDTFPCMTYDGITVSFQDEDCVVARSIGGEVAKYMEDGQ